VDTRHVSSLRDAIKFPLTKWKCLEMPGCLEIPFGNAVSFIATWQCRYNATWRGGGCVELFCFLSYFPRGSTVKKLFGITVLLVVLYSLDTVLLFKKTVPLVLAPLGNFG